MGYLKIVSENSVVVPAEAGTHNHRYQLLRRAGAPTSYNHAHSWLWAPAFAGATAVVWRAASQSYAASARRFQPLFRQEPHRSIRIHRFAEGKTLRVFAAQLVELDRIGVGLRAFGDHVHAEVVGERDDRLQDHRPRAAAGGADEGLVDLDGVEREALQIGERGMAGAEIIERQPGAELADARQHLRGVLGVLHHERFRQFQLQRAA